MLSKQKIRLKYPNNSWKHVKNEKKKKKFYTHKKKDFIYKKVASPTFSNQVIEEIRCDIFVTFTF